MRSGSRKRCRKQRTIARLLLFFSSPTALARVLVALVTGAALLLTTVVAQAPALDIKKLSLEQLAEIDVYSASRRVESVQRAASAIYVLTGENIRRSGVTRIPEALRLVPGVQVARVDANKWAVSIRGFNARSANKLLVLIDGCTIYDPLFSGVLWESQDVMLDDIDRIEVIRGVGGIVNLVDVQGRIRFQLNQVAAESAGLTISSKLLGLAVK